MTDNRSLIDLITEVIHISPLHGMPFEDCRKVAKDIVAAVRRHYEGKPAIEGKPLELQTRDELLAYIRQHQADHSEDMLEKVKPSEYPGMTPEEIAEAIEEDRRGEVCPFTRLDCSEIQDNEPNITDRLHDSISAALINAEPSSIEEIIRVAIHHFYGKLPIEPAPEPVSSELPTVNLWVGAKAMHAAGYTNDLSERDGFIQEEYVDQAKACAEAWGLKWK